MSALDNQDPYVQEARRRLAARNGKASMLPAMLEIVRNELSQGSAQELHRGEVDNAVANNKNVLQRGEAGEIYSYNPEYDITTIQLPNGSQATRRGDARPNKLDELINEAEGQPTNPTAENIDQAVQGAVNGDVQYSAPLTPVEEGEFLPDPTLNQQPVSDEEVTEDESNLLRNLMIGGGGAAGLYFLSRYLRNGGWSTDGMFDPTTNTYTDAEPDLNTTANIEEENPNRGSTQMTDRGTTEPTEYARTTQKGSRIVDTDVPQISQDLTPAMRIDTAFNQPDPIEVLLNDFAGDTEQSTRVTNQQTTSEVTDTKSYLAERIQTPDGTKTRADIFEQARSMSNVRDAVNFLRDNGIDIINNELARRAFSDIVNRNRDVAKGASRRAGSKAARSAARGAF